MTDIEDLKADVKKLRNEVWNEADARVEIERARVEIESQKEVIATLMACLVRMEVRTAMPPRMDMEWTSLKSQLRIAREALEIQREANEEEADAKNARDA